MQGSLVIIHLVNKLSFAPQQNLFIFFFIQDFMGEIKTNYHKKKFHKHF